MGWVLKVFISWSKNSRQVGKAVSDAVKEIFDPVVTTFISQEIKAGARGLEEIDASLNETDFGIICLTRSNQTEQWINYEAGALSRQVEDKRSRMGVFLVDLTVDEVNSPMNIFQCKLAKLEGFTDLMSSLNDLASPGLNENTLNKRINAAWPDVEQAVKAVLAGEPDQPVTPPKTSEEKLDELIGLVKAMEASLGDELLLRRNLDPISAAQRHRLLMDPRLQDSYAHGAAIPRTFRTLAGEEHVIPEPDLERITQSVVAQLRREGNLGQVKVGIGQNTIHIRTEREVPRKVKERVIGRLAGLYQPEDIKFVARSFDEDANDDSE